MELGFISHSAVSVIVFLGPEKKNISKREPILSQRHEAGFYWQPGRSIASLYQTHMHVEQDFQRGT